MAMIAYKCPDIQVVVVDINAARIAAWNSDVSSVPHMIYRGISLYRLWQLDPSADSAACSQFSRVSHA